MAPDPDPPGGGSDGGEPVLEKGRRRRGPGRVLVTVYGIFALGATSRAVYQIATRFHEAPLAYLLSAFSALVYVLATVMFTRSGRISWRIAVASCTVELVGVLAVGTASVADPAAFPDSTVWSLYGMGYLFVPVVLPVLGLLWLLRGGGRPGPAPTQPAP